MDKQPASTLNDIHHPRPRLAACLCILLAAAVGGCKEAPGSGQAPPPAEQTAPQAWPAKRKTDGGNFTVAIQPDGGGIVTNRHFSLEVLVEPAAGNAAPVGVIVDADMPDHGHGMNTKPETAHEGGPRYRTKGMLFHMMGEWSIVVEVSTASGKERAFFPVLVE